jgi:hypothetical protein
MSSTTTSAFGVPAGPGCLEESEVPSGPGPPPWVSWETTDLGSECYRA